MKKFAALALIATAAAGVQAQSTLTMFGIVDLGVRNVKNGDNSMKSLSSNGINTSRIGLRGSEDLGDGLTAGFWLESGLNPNNGSNSDSTRFWNRRSTVSLNGNMGELRLGRDFSPTYTGWSDYDPFGDNGIAAGGKFNTKMGTTVDTNTRADNQIAYFLPKTLGGIYGRFSVAAGQGTSGKKYTGGRVGYAAGPLDVSVSLGQTSVTALTGSTDDKFKVMSLGASYDLGVAKLSGYYTENKYAALKTDIYNLAVAVPVTALASVKLGYTHVNAKGVLNGVNSDANDANQLAIGGQYNLSKRTAVYATVARVDNKGGATYVVDSNPALLAGGKKSTGYELGLRHAF